MVPRANDAVVKAFSEGWAPDHRQGAAHLWAEGNTLYSYGRHFPLAVRLHKTQAPRAHSGDLYLCNGDRYSVTTSHHQGITFRYLRNHPRVSFSALAAALGGNRNREWGWRWTPDLSRVNVVDFWEDSNGEGYFDSQGQQVPDPWRRDADGENLIPFNPPLGAITGIEKFGDGNIVGSPAERRWWHRIGAVLLSAPRQQEALYPRDYYLCAMDEGSYFISRLYRKVKTVAEAFESLKPRECQGEVLRQGEWFFMPLGTPKELGIPLRAFKRGGYTLPLKRDGGNLHVCTWGTFLRHPMLRHGAGWAVMGRVRHWNPLNRRRTGEHRTVRLNKGIVYQAICNTSLMDWSSGGRVD